MKKQLKMSKKKKFTIVLISAMCLLAIIFPTVALAADYLSENDPLVTLSYLKDIFAPALKQEIKDEIASGSPSVEETPAEKPQEASASVGYEVLELSKGQKLASKNGTVEIIVRPGSVATVISDIPDNGLSDISAMTEVMNGEQAQINHALIIPRNDGRGIVIESDTAFVLVRGDYVVE